MTAVAAIAAALWLPISKYDVSFGFLPEKTAKVTTPETKTRESAPVQKTADADSVKTLEAPPSTALTEHPASAPVAAPGIVEAASVAPTEAASIVKTESLPPPATQQEMSTPLAATPAPETKTDSSLEAAQPFPASTPSTETAASSESVVPAKVQTPAAEQVASLIAPPAAKVDAPVEKKVEAEALVKKPEPTAADPVLATGPKPHEGLAAIVRAWKLAVLQQPPADVTWSSIVKFATSNGLRALSMSPNTTQIATIDLPVLVRLRDGNALEWAAITSMSGGNISLLRGDGSEEELKADAFRKAYTGDAFYLWNDPDPKAEPLRARTEGEAVTDLQADLKTLGLLDRDPTGTYDVATIEAVGRIQRATGIAVDGVTGPQTRMVLISWLDRAGAPNLTPNGFTDNVRARVLALPGMITAGAPGELESIPLPETLPVATATSANDGAGAEKAGP